MGNEETWTMRGLSGGLFLVENIRDEASESRASAPRPYTVSVGNATGCLRLRRWWDAILRASSVAGELISGCSAEGGNDIEATSQTRTRVVKVILFFGHTLERSVLREFIKYSKNSRSIIVESEG